MYLSRIELNMGLRATKKAISSPQTMHAVVESSFPGNDISRKLWRTDRIGNSLFLLLVSEQKPDFRHIVEQFGWLASGQKWETRDYDFFLGNISNGQKWRFRLRANPTHALSSLKPGKRGKVVAHVTVGHQEDWLKSQAARHGFNLVAGKVVQSDTKKFEKGHTDDMGRSVDKGSLAEKGHPSEKGYSAGSGRNLVTLGTATFEGLLEVNDAEQLRKALTDGIGRAKAYGCGLLTLARI